MTRSVFACSFAALCIFAGVASAQNVPIAPYEPALYERVLLPSGSTVSVRGAGGTEWSSYLRIENRSNTSLINGVDIVALRSCDPLGCYPSDVLPGSIGGGSPLVVLDFRLGPVPALLHIRRERSSDVRLALRVIEFSKGLNAGTEIPIVREQDFRSDAVTLTDIPIGYSRFRSKLRVYDVDANSEASVALELGNGRQLTTRARKSAITEFPLEPGYVDIDLTPANFPELPGPRYFNLRLVPLTPGLRYWAYVTIIDNQTQQVYLSTPLR